MQLEIKQLQRRLGATIIYVTHDQEEALTLSDRVAVMHNGRLEQIGQPFELYANPNTAFIADFVGTINFIPGVIVGDERNHSLVRLASGAVIKAAKRAKAPVGSAVSVAARPEHMAISASPGTEQISLPGTVEAVVFSGAHRVAHVRLKAMDGLTVRVTLAGETSIPTAGEPLTLYLSPDRLQLFSAQTGRRL